MTSSSSQAELEPIVAHGARMSWAGLLRPGDEFCLPIRSRLVTLESTDGDPLRRSYGGWSSRYRRFTSNLSTPKLRVRATADRRTPERSLHGILHWVRRSDVVRTGPGGVCHGDGWPVELWGRFLSRLDQLPGTSVADKLEAFARSTEEQEIPIVAEWRGRLSGRPTGRDGEPSLLGEGWIPVPARLEGSAGSWHCVVSWSASPIGFASLREALAAAPSLGKAPDPTSQARYYLECMLAKLHGVTFGPSDSLEDPWFEETSALRRQAPAYYELERARVAEAQYGRLDDRG